MLAQEEIVLVVTLFRNYFLSLCLSVFLRANERTGDSVLVRMMLDAVFQIRSLLYKGGPMFYSRAQYVRDLKDIYKA